QTEEGSPQGARRAGRDEGGKGRHRRRSRHLRLQRRRHRARSERRPRVRAAVRMAYQSTAIAVTHPARLRAEAMRHGHGSWSPRGFRYLEIGCGDATNLVALAERFPEARFTGLDIDAAAIDAG